MLNVKTYLFPKSVDEAYELLNSKKTAALIGGGAYLRMSRKTLDPAIDLKNCGLDQITTVGGRIYIGACVTLGDLERSSILQASSKGMLKQALVDIVGVAFRNSVLIGATVGARYGFSDINTALMALDTRVHLHAGGEVPIEVFMEKGMVGKDIVTGISLSDQCHQAVFKSVRLSHGDYAILNMAVAKVGEQWRIAVGARPGRAVLAYSTMQLLNESTGSEEDMGAKVAQELIFGSNTRGGSDYRAHLATVLIKKCLKDLRGGA